jgi:hypothetical protein
MERSGRPNVEREMAGEVEVAGKWVAESRLGILLMERAARTERGEKVGEGLMGVEMRTGAMVGSGLVCLTLVGLEGGGGVEEVRTTEGVFGFAFLREVDTFGTGSSSSKARRERIFSLPRIEGGVGRGGEARDASIVGDDDGEVWIGGGMRASSSAVGWRATLETTEMRVFRTEMGLRVLEAGEGFGEGDAEESFRTGGGGGWAVWAASEGTREGGRTTSGRVGLSLGFRDEAAKEGMVERMAWTRGVTVRKGR